jgi:hypothetical protein
MTTFFRLPVPMLGSQSEPWGELSELLCDGGLSPGVNVLTSF